MPCMFLNAPSPILLIQMISLSSNMIKTHSFKSGVLEQVNIKDMQGKASPGSGLINTDLETHNSNEFYYGLACSVYRPSCMFHNHI